MGYAATAMPVRFAVERRDWETAARLPAATNVPPEVMAVSIWARAVALARLGRISDASSETDKTSRNRTPVAREGK